MSLAFTVFGIAAPGGSKRGFINRHTGKVVVTDASRRAKPWQAVVAAAAGDAVNGSGPLAGPLELELTIYLPRPKGHYGTGRNAETLRASAPPYPDVKPDATKLLRAIEDACTGIVWRDDAQIVVQTVRKLYGSPARVEIRCVPANEPAL